MSQGFLRISFHICKLAFPSTLLHQAATHSEADFSFLKETFILIVQKSVPLKARRRVRRETLIMIQYFRSAMDNILAKGAAIFDKYGALRVRVLYCKRCS